MSKGFRLKKSKIGEYEELTFENHKGVKFSVIPQFGARVNTLNLRMKKADLDLISGFKNKEEMVSDHLCKSAILFPFPNRLDGGRYQFENKSYQFPINEPEFNTSLHGFLTRSPFEVEKMEYDQKKVHVKLMYEYLGEEEYYPFPFTFTVSYKIDADSNFKVKFKVENTGGKNMPIGLGWHPYFNTTGWTKQVRLKLPAANEIEINERLLPTGVINSFEKFRTTEPLADEKYDACLELNQEEWETQLVSQENSQIGINIKADNNFRYLQIYQPPGSSLLAIEPVTCNIDAFNNTMGLVILEPAGIYKAQVKIKVNSKSR